MHENTPSSTKSQEKDGTSSRERLTSPEDYVGQDAHQLSNRDLIRTAADLLTQAGHAILTLIGRLVGCGASLCGQAAVDRGRLIDG